MSIGGSGRVQVVYLFSLPLSSAFTFNFNYIEHLFHPVGNIIPIPLRKLLVRVQIGSHVGVETISLLIAQLQDGLNGIDARTKVFGIHRFPTHLVNGKIVHT